MVDDGHDPIERGDVIDGRFLVERMLGRGGMGVVVLAKHLQLQELVAIKLLRPEAAQDEQSRARFLREARASARLRSEHVVRLMDFGLDESGSPIIVMEYLHGADLGSLLAAGPLAIDDTVEYLLQAAEGIAEAHAHGLVHRDLKPGNLFVTRATDGSKLVKVLDFGVSKLISVEDSAMSAGLTDAKTVVGSPGYMSPEQLSGDATDLRTDVWALGIILFECLTGRTPFGGRSIPQLFSSILDKEPMRIDELRDGVPPCLQELIGWCLRKSAEERCPDTAAFAEALVKAAPTPHRLLRVERIARLARVANETNSQHRADTSVPPGTVPAAWSRKRTAPSAQRRWPWGVGAGVAALLIVTAAVGWYQGRSAGLDSEARTQNGTASVRTAFASAAPVAPPASSALLREADASAEAGRAAEPESRPPPTTKTRRPARSPKATVRDPLDGWEPLEEQP